MTTDTTTLAATLRRVADGHTLTDCLARVAADRLEELEHELAVWKHGTMLLESELQKFDEKAIEWWCEYQDLKAKLRP
jgi:hypothetical protein